VTAGDDAPGRGGWVPTGPPPGSDPGPADPAAGHLEGPAAHLEGPAAPHLDGPVADPDTQPLTRASIRAAQARQLSAEAEERRRTSLAEESAVPRRARLVAVGSAVALAVLVGLSALVGVASTALAVGFTSVVLAWGWVRLTDAPSPRVTATVLGAAAVAIAAAAGLTTTDPYLVWVPVAVAVSAVVVFLQQLFRSGGRPRLTEAIAASLGALAVMASGATVIPLSVYPHGGPWTLAAVLGVVGAALPVLLLGGRWSPGWVLLAALLAGTGIVVAAAALATGIPLLGAALAGVLVAAVSHSMMRVLLALPGAASAQAAVSVGAAGVLVVGVLVYLLARIFSG
jgi:hypothetical protein